MNRVLIFTVLSVFSCFGIFSCDKKNNQAQRVEVQLDQTTRYGTETIIFPEISENAQTYIASWIFLDDFQLEAGNLNGSTIAELQIKTERLLAHADSLAVKIPDTLNTNLITSRLMVVKTRTNLLHQEVHRARLDSAKIANNLFEFNTSVKNFIVQINEKFAKDAIDQQRKSNEKKELEKQKKFLDSVYQAELQDKN